MKFYFTCLAVLLGGSLFAQQQAPVVSNLNIQRSATDTTTVQVDFQLADAENDPCEVWIRYSVDGGHRFREVLGASGDVGFPVQPGNRSITFNTQSLLDVTATPVIIRVVASDRTPVDVAEMVARVDSNRLRARVAAYAIPRNYVAQTATLNRVRDSLEAQFARQQLPVMRHNFVFNAVNCANIIAMQAGHADDSAVWIVDAHFDGVAVTPGADDNASGVAGVLEIAEILSDYEFEEGIQYIGFDVEEEGLVGSRRLVTTALNPADRIRGVFNLEMIGYYTEVPNTQQLPAGFGMLFPAQQAIVAADSFRGNFLANVGNVNSLPLTALFDSAAAQFAPALKVVSLNLPGNGTIAPDFRRSDHAPFWDANYQALMLTDGANFRNLNYHTPGDSVAILNFTFMSNVVKATLAATAMGAKPMSAGKADAVYGFALQVDDNHPPHADCRVVVKPNPSEGFFTVELAACAVPYGPADLRIFSLDGRLHHEQRLQRAEAHSIDIRLALPAGTYLLVIDNGHEAYTEKLLLR